jgi:polysaccharide biosynthesis/export protein
MKLPYRLILLPLLCLLCFTSCVNTKKAVYFNHLPDTEFESRSQDLEPVLQPNDLLSITVSSPNPEATEVFNIPNTTSTQTSAVSGNITQASGYLINQDGYIQFPYLGNVKAAGLTKKELRDKIATDLLERKLLIEPIVNIRYLNYKVSVLGEVDNPSVVTIPNEKVTLLEAIGLAGDMTIYAKRDNVLLIREENGKKKVVRLDLTSDKIFTSPYYYLKSNDIIYVEPNKARIASTGRLTQWMPVMFSALSVAVIVIDRMAR